MPSLVLYHHIDIPIGLWSCQELPASHQVQHFFQQSLTLNFKAIVRYTTIHTHSASKPQKKNSMIVLYTFFGFFAVVAVVIIGMIMLARWLYRMIVRCRVTSTLVSAQEQQAAAPAGDPSGSSYSEIEEGKKQARRLKILTTLVQKVSSTIFHRHGTKRILVVVQT